MGVIAPGSLQRWKADVYLVNGYDSAIGPAAEALRAFVYAGGGVVIANHVWADSAAEKDVASNKFLQPTVRAAWAAAGAGAAVRGPPAACPHVLACCVA